MRGRGKLSQERERKVSSRERGKLAQEGEES